MSVIQSNRDHMAVVSARRRQDVLEFIRASAVEVLARKRFREEPSPGNLTTWTTAKNDLDDKMGKL